MEEALRLAEATGERFCEPELFRLRATVELGLPAPNRELSLSALRRALRQAREQEAWAVEERVARQMEELGSADGLASLGRERATVPDASGALGAVTG